MIKNNKKFIEFNCNEELFARRNRLFRFIANPETSPKKRAEARDLLFLVEGQIDFQKNVRDNLTDPFFDTLVGQNFPKNLWGGLLHQLKVVESLLEIGWGSRESAADFLAYSVVEYCERKGV